MKPTTVPAATIVLVLRSSRDFGTATVAVARAEVDVDVGIPVLDMFDNARVE